MTLQEAYLKAKSEWGKKGFTLLFSCYDYGEFWGFMFIRPTDENLIKELNGGGDITINKKTGAIGYFYPTMDLNLSKNAIPIPIEHFAEYNVAI